MSEFEAGQCMFPFHASAVIGHGTESWLTPDISKSRTNLYGYEQFRNDRLPEDSGKTIGGGILMYIDKRWSTNNQTIYNHMDNHCEIMIIKSRPQWLPREFSSIISISCYTPFTGYQTKRCYHPDD